MAVRRVDPKDQFSKKLAKWSAWFWFVYMTLVLVAIVIEPNSADAAIYLAGFTSIVMLLNIGAYTSNSIYDKAIAAGAEVIGKFRFTWKKKQQSNEGSDFNAEVTEDEESMTIDEGGGNG